MYVVWPLVTSVLKMETQYVNKRWSVTQCHTTDGMREMFYPWCHATPTRNIQLLTRVQHQHQLQNSVIIQTLSRTFPVIQTVCNQAVRNVEMATAKPELSSLVVIFRGPSFFDHWLCPVPVASAETGLGQQAVWCSDTDVRCEFSRMVLESFFRRQ